MTRGGSYAAFCLTLSLAAGGCGALPADGAGVATESAPILGGVLDPGNEAVMALVHQMGLDGSNGCTGTTIAKVGASGIFLTAAHCVVETDGMGHVVTPIKVAGPEELYVIPGADWAASLRGGLYYGVTAVNVHPQYDGNVKSQADLALVRFVGATAATPVIPALSAAEDAKLGVGSPFTLVGYGKTESNGQNSQKRKVDRSIQALNALEFLYDQTDAKGACAGDSGGPALVTTPAGVRVAGVTSFGDADCMVLGASVRVAPAAAVIQAFVDATPATLSCQDCTLAAVGPGNQCVGEGVACGTATTSCGKYLTCVNACADSACATRCQQTQAAGAASYVAMVACQCGGVCAPACRSNQACAAYLGGAPPTTTCGGLPEPRPACASCEQSTCCSEASACGADAICKACISQASDSCAANAAFAKLTACTATCGGAPCAATTTPPVDAGKSGCSCVVAVTGAPPGTAALIALGALLLARRRRAVSRTCTTAPARRS